MRPQMMKRFVQVSAVTIPPTKYRSDCSMRFLEVKVFSILILCHVKRFGLNVNVETQYLTRKYEGETAPFPCVASGYERHTV